MTESQLYFANYAVAFLDLLGQRDAMSDENLLPAFTTDAEKNEFTVRAKRIIGSIGVLQKRARELEQGYKSITFEDLKVALPNEYAVEIDAFNAPQLQTQYWSDGLVLFSALKGNQPLLGLSVLYQLIAKSGAICYMGLASGEPIRGGIEIAWGVELNKGEIYGPAVARAYELESSVACLPRIVIGENAISFLDAASQFPDSAFVRATAQSITSQVLRDEKGTYLVHYLSRPNNDDAAAPHREVYPRALAYIDSQLQKHDVGTKLHVRYSELRDYFIAHRP